MKEIKVFIAWWQDEFHRRYIAVNMMGALFSAIAFEHYKHRQKGMSKQNVSQDLFLKVKERLDYHRLPAQFPIQAAPLIHKLLSIVDGNIENRGSSQLPKSQGLLDNALKYEIARVVKENNELHLTIMNAKEQIQSLEHRLYKWDANKHSKEIEVEKYEQMKQKREEELVNELREVRYKYNELMDFLHEDPNQDREYIKRLLKHKTTSPQDYPAQQQGHHPQRIIESHNHQSKHLKVKELEQKILHRDQEISRLHRLIEYDGVSLNKLISSFNQQLVRQQLNSADSKINYLQTSYDKIKRENSRIKSNNGSKEALRAEVDSCHRIIQQLKQQNQQLTRNAAQQLFDLHARTAENERNIHQAKADKQGADNLVAKNQQTVRDLSKKIEFIQKQLDEAKRLQQIAVEKASGLQIDNGNLLKKLAEGQFGFEYQIENAKKRVRQSEFQLQQAQLRNQETNKELEVVLKESQLKSQAINNLEKIVNQLIKKNSLLAGNTTFAIEESLKRSEDLELKRKVIELEQRLIHSQNERTELQIKLKTADLRLGQLAKQNERFKYQNGELRQAVSKGEVGSNKLICQVQQLKILLKREQADHARTLSQNNEEMYQKESLVLQLREENQKLSHLEKASKMRLKDLQIKISEEEGVWQVTRIRLQEKEARIKQLQKLLAEATQQKKSLAYQLSELEQEAHQASREKHRIAKKYEQVQKDNAQFKQSSLKSYSAAINDNLNEVKGLKKQLGRLSEANENLRIRYEEVGNLLDMIRRQKELVEFNLMSCARENEDLKARLYEMHDLEKALLVENQNLISLARRN